jgi:hypothetical protein
MDRRGAASRYQVVNVNERMSEMFRLRRSRSGFERLGRLIGLGLAAAALYREYRKPEVLRTGHGEVAGFVPYDFRIPSLGKIIHSFWAPEDDRLLTPMAFGVGWTINLGWFARRFGLAS